MIQQSKQYDNKIVKTVPYRGNRADSGEWKIVTNFTPEANCIIISHDDFKTIEIHCFQIFEVENRRQGIGTIMMRTIRNTYPESFIWTDTFDHSRPFWQKMVDFGYVDRIANDYSWPCFDTNCEICHPQRNSDIRRGFKIRNIKKIGGEKHE